MMLMMTMIDKSIAIELMDVPTLSRTTLFQIDHSTDHSVTEWVEWVISNKRIER